MSTLSLPSFRRHTAAPLALALAIGVPSTAALGQTPRLLLDLDPTPRADPSSGVDQITHVGPVTYFLASDGAGGEQLWKTARIPGSTELVVDPSPGVVADMSSLVPLGNRLLFVDDPSTTAATLYATDGTAAGTVPLLQSVTIERPLAAGARAWFVTPWGAQVVWQTDGTAAGTAPFPAMTGIQGVAEVGGQTLLFGDTPAVQDGLFALDAQGTGVALVRDLYGGVPGRPIGAKLFFAQQATSSRAPLRPWVSDGTPAGTFELVAADEPKEFTDFGGTAVFVATTQAHDEELWFSDGTTAGTRVLDVAPGNLGTYPHALTVVGSRLFFAGWDHGLGTEALYVSDGTLAGTRVVASLDPTGQGSPFEGLARVGNGVVFALDDGIHGREPWFSDGTAAGTKMLADLQTGAQGSYPGQVTTDPSGLAALFAADDGVHGGELWITDGTMAGTSLLANILSVPPGATLDSAPSFEIDDFGSVLFTAGGGNECWRTDGTGPGTIRLPTVPLGWFRPGGFVQFGDRVVFTTVRLGVSLAITDSAGNGWQELAGGLLPVSGAEPLPAVAVGPIVVFESRADLRATDGTPAGTRVIRSGFSFNGELIQLSGRVLFAASNAQAGGGTELWSTDGTTAGTVLVRDIRPGSLSSDPSALTAFGDRVLFSARGATEGTELWSTDGTLGGTRLVRDVNPGAAGSDPQELTAASGRLYFSAVSGATGREPWVSDGTSAGTLQLLDVRTGAGSSSPREFTAIGDRVVFVATDDLHGTELWVTDGTPAGTALLADIAPGTDGSNPSDLCATGDRRVWFAADDRVHGSELWVTDGTPAGTRLVADIAPGADSSSPADFLLAAGKLFFAATDPVVGREPFVLDEPGASSKPLGVAFGAHRTHLNATDPVIGGTFGLSLRDAAPNLDTLLLISPRARPQQYLPGVWLYFDHGSSVILAAGRTDASGRFDFAIPLPAALGVLRGFTLSAQAIVGPTATVIGADLSNAAHATFGS